MKILLLVAWRNIWRHPARSGALLAAVMIGLWAGVVTVGATNATMKQRVDYLIESEVAHVQVHHPDFLAEGYARDSIPDHEAISAWLDRHPLVVGHTARAIADGMLQSAVRTAGVRIRGIDPATETRTTTFHTKLVAGEYLDTDMRNPILVGRNLAAEHRVDIGHRLVLTFENAKGELTSGAFHVAGFFASASSEYDKRNVFVRGTDLLALLSDRPASHEIAILLADEGQAAAVAAELNREFEGIKARTWRELSPELNVLVAMGDFMLYLITMIIMAALAFGILNTMLMALFERLREIGMLLSIGMSRGRVFAMILLEAVMLALVGALGGMLLAWLSMARLGRVGINLERFAAGFAKVGWDPVIYPYLSAREYAAILVVVVAVTLLAALYPAWKAVRIKPLEAARDG